MIHPHPDTRRLRERMRSLVDAAKPWSGTWYRATTAEFANRQDLLAGVGSRMTGGRWNAPESFNAVYGCLEPETAMAEALANYRGYGIPVSEAMPLVFVAVTVELQAVLDLTDRESQRILGVTARTMRSTPWRTLQEQGQEAVTQALGRIAWEQRLEGVLVPSSRVAGAVNVVLFPGRRREGSLWRIPRAKMLPRKRRK
jgi:RES domain-containing protein